jgi:hypothetical protein
MSTATRPLALPHTRAAWMAIVAAVATVAVALVLVLALGGSTRASAPRSTMSHPDESAIAVTLSRASAPAAVTCVDRAVVGHC